MAANPPLGPLPRHVAHLHMGLTWGGGEDQVMRLVRALVATGVTPSLWARQGGALLERALRLGLPVRALPPGWRMPWGSARFARALAGAGVDLLHCHDSRALGLGLRVRRRLQVPLVLARRVASPLRSNPVSRLKYSPRRIDAVVAVSEAVRDVVCAGGFPPDRVKVVPSGLDVAELDELACDDRFRQHQGATYLVAGIGKLAPRKNWDLLIRTAARVATAGIGARWLLVGDGPERRRLEDLTCTLGASSFVRFLGFREDAAAILKCCDLLFFPSLREGASISVRQAMLLAVPVVAVSSPGVVESLSGHGWLIAPDDVDGAADAVIEALTDQERREAVCRDARRSAVDRFAFERTLEGTLDVYRSVVSRLRPDDCRS